MASFDTAWVLVIEDLRDRAELWSDVCAEAGLKTTTAANGVQGYRKACESQPAIVLLDLQLPDIDGWEVCRRLKTDDRTKRIPIVLLTARDEPDGAALAKATGCAAYLKKPCHPMDVVAVLKRVLSLVVAGTAVLIVLMGTTSAGGPVGRYSEWTEPVWLGPIINFAANDFGAAESKDGLALYFTSTRPNGFGNEHIWVSRRVSNDAPWAEPINLGPLINTDALDRVPNLSRDGHWLIVREGIRYPKFRHVDLVPCAHA